MKFAEAVQGIRTLTELRRIAGAHVVDHRRLTDDELRAAILKVQPQYLHEETVRTSLYQSLYKDPENDTRVLS